MRERPILFSAPMVRALLDGTKTQTRRVCKPAQAAALSCVVEVPDLLERGQVYNGSHFGNEEGGVRFASPYGQPGDRLWVREAWARTHVFGQEMTVYREGDNRTDYGGPWKPGIHMFRRDSRILLEITGMRVERLQDICGADADAEGCERLDSERDVHDWTLCPQCGGTGLYTSFGPNLGACPDTDCQKCDTYVKRYRYLWEAINGADSWDANPWVWAVEFRRARP